MEKSKRISNQKRDKKLLIFDHNPIVTVSRHGDRWNQIFDSLVQTYHKLTALGFTYYNGKVAIIEISEEDGKASSKTTKLKVT